jgi:leucyl-tRNA synthetase
MLYKAPPSDNLDWDDHSIIGIKRWLNKLDKLIETPTKENSKINLQELNQEAKNLYRTINFTIKEVTQSFETNYQFNTAIAFLIKLTHSLTNYSQLKGFNPSDPVYSYGVKVLIQMLSPMAPRKAQTLWDQYFISKSGDKVDECRWPKVDLEGLKEDKVNVVIQVS